MIRAHCELASQETKGTTESAEKSRHSTVIEVLEERRGQNVKSVYHVVVFSPLADSPQLL